jgi:hypothetical protein
MSPSIQVVDDEPDVALLFRHRFHREVREGTYVMHFANSGEMAPEQLTNRPDADRDPLRHLPGGSIRSGHPGFRQEQDRSNNQFFSAPPTTGSSLRVAASALWRYARRARQ